MNWLWELTHQGGAHSQTCWFPLSKGKGSSRAAASKMSVDNRVGRKQFTFYSSGPKTTKEAFQGEIDVAVQNISRYNFFL